MSNLNEEHAAKVEAAENVVERAESWDHGAQPDTVARNLEEGFAEAGVDVDDTEVAKIAEDIHDVQGTDIDPDAVS